ncbi:MAG: EscR/YscR/HrcR family type III secretion system export apparatus protein, partial [Bdellovibrionales bacterium]|nr:EscR/YscR/HrcR family type III secretion system export apparatus protein [Bdellovibrionales bacterium]
QVVKGVFEPFAEFMRFHSGKRELETLQRLAPSLERELSQDSSDEPTALHIALPAFVLTELKEAFAMGFVLLLPFLAIDLIVANILVGLGMFMVSPVMVALPLKLLLFIMADGWLLLTQGLIRSYGAG